MGFDEASRIGCGRGRDPQRPPPRVRRCPFVSGPPPRPTQGIIYHHPLFESGAVLIRPDGEILKMAVVRSATLCGSCWSSPTTTPAIRPWAS